jgi:hypothetical protein
MTSFYQENQHFIKLKLISEMRHLSVAERRIRYSTTLQAETRLRAKKYYSKLSAKKEKVAFFTDMIDYLKEFEWALIIYSIYFDKDGSIFKELKLKLAASWPTDFGDHYSILEFCREGTESIEDHFNNVLSEYLGVKVQSIKNSLSNELSNPEANKFSDWLVARISEKNSYDALRLIVFHFSKFWNNNYSTNYSKGIVLLNKIEKTILELGFNNLKINLKDILEEMKTLTRQLLCTEIIVPYLDSSSAAKNRHTFVIPGYLKKLDDLSELLNKTEVFFKDLSILSLVELYETHCHHEKYRITLYQEEVKSRIIRGVLPTTNDIKFFSDSAIFENASDNEWRTAMLHFITRSNYIFCQA